MTAKEVMEKLLADGWIEKLPRKKGSQRQFIHPVKPGKITVPEHKGQDIKIGTLKSIEKQSGIKFL